MGTGTDSYVRLRESDDRCCGQRSGRWAQARARCACAGGAKGVATAGRRAAKFALIELGRPEEAIPWLEKAMTAKRYCCYHYAHVNMGRILLSKGRLAEAKRAFERALAYDPAYVPALKGLELIRRLGFETL